MESHAKLLGHPIHPMLVNFPLGLLPTAMIFDIVYLSTHKNPPISELAEIDDLRIVGEVRSFDANAVQSDVGVPATDDRLKDVQGKPVLYAFQVIVPPGSKGVMQ